jgi:hypothetical protein
MTAKDFFKAFPDEAACIAHLRKVREQNGLVCRKCSSHRLSWLSTIDRWECMDCRAKTTIRSGTIMMHSKLAIHTWFQCIFFMSSTTKAVSAKDMQRRLDMKRYEPVWYMMQKIRKAMGQVNSEVRLSGFVEFDDGYFTAHKKEKDPHGYLFNRGRGTERKQPVLVAVEAIERTQPKARNDIKHNTRAGLLRMEHLPDLKGKTYSKMAKRLLSSDTIVKTDANPSYNAITGHVAEHKPKKSGPGKAVKAMPWVHVAISNAKRVFLGVYHHLSDLWLQSYLDEFCYKFNLRFKRHDIVNQLIKTVALNRLHSSG